MAAAKPAKGSRQTKLSRKAHIEQARKRLLGTWRSDKKRTLNEWVFQKNVTPKLRKLIREMFGHLTWRFTKNRLYYKSKVRSGVSEYSLLWADEYSAILHVKADRHLSGYHIPDLFNRDKCYHMHFDGKRFMCLPRGAMSNISGR